MACKPFKTSEANAKSFLKTNGAIDKFLNIKNLSKFRDLHTQLRKQLKIIILVISQIGMKNYFLKIIMVIKLHQIKKYLNK